MPRSLPFPILTAAEAAAHVRNGATVGFSGFTPAGAAKAVPRAIAAHARELHSRNEPFQIRVLTGASTGAALDETLAQANAISWRAPYQSSRTLREQMNAGAVSFIDMHLSHLPQALLEGFLGRMDVAVIEATDVMPDGRVFLSSSIGASPTFLRCADRVIIEINRAQSPRLAEMADVFHLDPPPHRNAIPLRDVMSRIGTPWAACDPKKIIGIVETNEPDDVSPFTEPDAASDRIAEHVVNFLIREHQLGRIPKEFLPLQAGVGNVANAVMIGLGKSTEIPPFTMYTEVFQDGLVGLMESGKLVGASTTALTLSPSKMKHVFDNIDFFAPRIVLRPQEISNNPGIVRRLGVITINTALEIDIYGHINSTHVAGTQMMNGIGGSGDFTRNAYLSIYMAPSVAKGGRISTIVPMASHVDHNEHSVQIVVTEQGIADLRGLGPAERAKALIENCAHPLYRDYLMRYVAESRQGHLRHDLAKCFELHRNLLEFGTMLPS